MLKRIVRRAARAAGYELRRIQQEAPQPSTLSAALDRLRRGGASFNSVIDVGASDGRWSAALETFYPAAQYLLVEAQPVHEPALKEFCRARPNTRYALTAAGREEGEIYFEASDPFGGVASYTPFEKNCLRVPVTPVDALAAALPPPYLLKLDTHGFEVPIFDGAARTLGQTNVIIVECYNFRIAPECLLFHEMCRYLSDRGFHCSDLFDPLYRPRDGAFWQVDLLFERADHPKFSYNAYV